MNYTPFALSLLLGLASAAGAAPAAGDWLLDPAPYKSRVTVSQDAVVLENGLAMRKIAVRPGAATMSVKCLSTGEEFVRGVSPEARLTIDGKEYIVGGLSGQPIYNYLLESWIKDFKPLQGAYKFAGAATGAIEARFPWKPRTEWIAHDVSWPAKGRHVAMRYTPPAPGKDGKTLPAVTVHYEIYDGAPLFSKWITVSNDTGRAIRIDTFTADELRLAEASGETDFERFPVPLNLHAESNYGYNGCKEWRGPDSAAIHYVTDKEYTTQEPYHRTGLFTLKCHPATNAGETLEPGETFESFRVWELLFDSTDRERRGLAMRRMYRLTAPWTCENPLMFHKTTARPKDIRAAIEQCRKTGFELVIMSFGSGFNLESKDPAYRKRYKELADEARAAGIVLGGYSLTSSRSAGTKADNVQNPKPVFGRAPCLCSRWGRDYLETLKSFMKEAGFGVFENDGPFPGDFCSATNHPYHYGKEDSIWKQWRAQSDLYRFCREYAIYVNQPDCYFMEGGNKSCGGYRETNWSLPRRYQVIIERQNVYDNNWTRNTSMHWMFVPLSQYHGGGAAATIEPLSKHLDHYSARFANLLGAGVQACWRGPRLYDTPETLAMVKKWVDFYKKNRRVLDGDMIHLRRPDGRDWDGWIMVDPQPGDGMRAIASLFNPLDKPVRRVVELPLYYAGLSGSAEIATGENAEFKTVPLDAGCKAKVEVEIPANGNIRVLIRRSK